MIHKHANNIQTYVPLIYCKLNVCMYISNFNCAYSIHNIMNIQMVITTANGAPLSLDINS